MSFTRTRSKHHRGNFVLFISLCCCLYFGKVTTNKNHFGCCIKPTKELLRMCVCDFVSYDLRRFMHERKKSGSARRMNPIVNICYGDSMQKIYFYAFLRRSLCLHFERNAKESALFPLSPLFFFRNTFFSGPFPHQVLASVFPCYTIRSIEIRWKQIA